MPDLTGDNGDELTGDEARAIASLHRLAKRWPRTLTLVSMGGTLHVIHSDDERFHSEYGPRTDAVLGTFQGIPNDGGDW